MEQAKATGANRSLKPVGTRHRNERWAHSQTRRLRKTDLNPRNTKMSVKTEPLLQENTTLDWNLMLGAFFIGSLAVNFLF